MKKYVLNTDTKIFVKMTSIIMAICMILSLITKDITIFIASCISTAIIFTVKWSVDQKYKHIKENKNVSHK